MVLSKNQKELMGKVHTLISATNNTFVFVEEENDYYVSFSHLLENFVHLEFTEKEAELHWKNILLRSSYLEKKLGSPVNAHLAIVDYFTSEEHSLISPMLIEVHVFKQTEKMAMVDCLTNTFNRRYMDMVLKKEYTRCHRYNKLFSLCIFDLDDFKRLNDTKGHQFGDSVLIELSAIIKDEIREEDILCRYGGEEFIIILPETDSSGAFYLTERIRTRLQTIPFFANNNITFSAGVSSFPSCAQDITSLIRVADKALYEAKFTGKNKTIEAPAERRRFWRFEKEWEVDIFNTTDTDRISSIKTKNISAGGLQFESLKKHNIDTSVSLVFKSMDSRIQAKQKEIKVQGTITWVNHQTDDKYSYGVCFSDTPDEIEIAFNKAI